MAIEAAFERLVGSFGVAEEAFQSLRLTVIEDRPPHGEVLLVERLGNLVEDLRGWLAEGRIASARSARRGRPSAGRLSRPPGAGHAPMSASSFWNTSSSATGCRTKPSTRCKLRPPARRRMARLDQRRDAGA